MRRIAPLIVTLAAGAHLASAGLIIVQEADQFGPTPGKMTMTTKVAGDHARVDVGDQLSSIVDLATGKTTSLLHAQKVSMELPQAAMDALTQKTPAAAVKPKLKPVGRKETISGYDCEEYAGSFQGLTITYWVTKELPHQKEILAQVDRLSSRGDPLKTALASDADFPGFPIRTVVNSPQFGNMTMTVISIKDAEIPASEFQVPADYHSMAGPQTPGAASAPAGH